MMSFILVIHIVFCIFLILVVLMQSSRENELSGLFMGGGGQPLFGPRSGNILTRITTILAVGFMITSLTLTVLSARRPRRVIKKILSEEEKGIPKSVSPVTPKALQPEKEPSGDLPR